MERDMAFERLGTLMAAHNVTICKRPDGSITANYEKASESQRAYAESILRAYNQEAMLAEIAALEASDRERQEFLALIVSKWQNEFIPLRNWARTKGYPG